MAGQRSPSLALVLDNALICRGMADCWRARLPAKLIELPAIPAAALFEFDDAAGLMAQFDALIRNGVAINDAPVSIRLSDGALPCRIGAWRATQGDDADPVIVVLATDVSKFKEAAQELAQLQSQYQIILDAAGEGIYGLDREGRVTFGNAATTDIVGWLADEMIGQKSHDVHHHSHPDGSHYPREECPIYAALTDGQIHRVDNEVFWHSTGRAVPVEYTSTPILNNGKPDGAVVIFRDVSERRALEKQRDEDFEEIRRLKYQLELERDYLREEIQVATNFGDVIGTSESLTRTLSQVESVASTPVSVLIHGESGVGKEALARAIHTKSPRSDKPLIKVNCASIPQELFESEFFGHIKGAFTGAHRDRIGRLQLADGGTLFLDEIGEIPMSQQGKLLRALQEGEFERVGDDRTTNVDVRIVAATNRNLMNEIEAGRFREDLYYRISVFPIEVPPLRDRLDDIAPLAAHFLAMSCRELGRPQLKLSQSQLSILKSQQWAGNIRELKNVIERAVISSSGSHLRLDLALPDAINEHAPTIEALDADPAEFVTAAAFKELEKANLTAALISANWKVYGSDGAAQLLGMKPSTLAYHMKTLNIVSPA